MGLLSKVIGSGLAIAALNKVSKDVHKSSQAKQKELERRNTICYFDDNISKEAFYVIVKRCIKDIKELSSFDIENTLLCGTITPEKCNSAWKFKIDFNDYGKITGNYWIVSENKQSDIPEKIAKKIANSICEYPNCIDDSYQKNLYAEELKEAIRIENIASCPYCGKKNYDENSKFCMYCGMRFHI